MLKTLLNTAAVMAVIWQLAGCAPSDSASSPALESITLSSGELVPSFDSGTTQYKAYVGEDISKVEVLAKTADRNARVSINQSSESRYTSNAEVSVSAVDSVVMINVTAYDGATQREYFVTLVSGEAPAEAASSEETSPDATETDQTTQENVDTGADSVSESNDGAGGSTNNENNQDNSDVTVSFDGWQQTQRLKSDQIAEGSHFGQSIAANDDYLVVGSPGSFTSQGRVEVFQRNNNDWEMLQSLTGNSGFGSRVAIRGSRIIISAPQANRIYSYTLDGDRFGLEEQFTAVGARNGDLFGSSLALKDNTLAVANLRSKNKDSQVHIYERSNSTWQLQQIIATASLGSHDPYSNNLALSADWLAVGSFGYDALCQKPGSDPGSVQLFRRFGGEWKKQQTLLASDGDAGDRFGYSVSFQDDRLVAGAQCEDGQQNGSPSQGAAYVFERQGEQWQQTAKLVASGGSAHSLFGDQVVALPGQIVVTASYDSSSGLTASGAAYVFEQRNREWVQTSSLRASNSGNYDRFGWAIGKNNDQIFIAAPNEDSPDSYSDQLDSKRDSGSVYVFQ